MNLLAGASLLALAKSIYYGHQGGTCHCVRIIQVFELAEKKTPRAHILSK